MEMDYANDYSYTDTYLFSNTAIGLEVGGYIGGSYFAHKYSKKARALTNKAQAQSAYFYGGGRDTTPRGKFLHGKAREAMNKSKSFKSVRNAARGMGYISLFALGFSIFDSIVGSPGLYGQGRRFNPEGNSQQAPYETSFFDSRAAFTQRQRALMVIHNSQLSNRAAFGNEAQFLHN